MRRLWLACLMVLGLAANAQATTNYYISPTGSDSNDGLSTGAPWLTFAKAFGGTGMAGSPVGCGNTLNLTNGLYGDGTSTGKIALAGRICTQAAPMTIRAVNQRQARISDSGSGNAIYLSALTAWITFDGIVANSTNLAGSSNGRPFHANNVDHITVKNALFRNSNTFCCSTMLFVNSRDLLVEDVELYSYPGHGLTFFTSKNSVARRLYGNPRAGSNGDLISMYPCENCILENGILDGTTSSGSRLGEMNATNDGGILMKGSKFLGSICFNCSGGPGIYPNARKSQGDAFSPTDITLQNNFLDMTGSGSDAIRMDSPVNILNDHNTILNGDGGIKAVDVVNGAATLSFTDTNNIVKGASGIGFSSGGLATWSGGANWSNGNGTAFSPVLPSNWNTGVASATTDPGLGDCKLWIPDGAAAKGAGTGGTDIGATILYRYVDGVLTTTPLWDPSTGEFPHGVTDLDGTNDDVGDSLFDVHKRLNVPYPGDTHTCNFPATYPTSTQPPANPATMVTGEGTNSTTFDDTLPAGLDFLLHCIVLEDSGGNVGSVATASSGGEALTFIAGITNAPSNSRRAELWRRTAPTSGVRSQAVTTTGTVTGMRTTSIEAEGFSAIGSSASATNISATLSATVTTNTNETIYDCVAAKKGVTLTAGANQTLQRDDAHSTQDLRSAISTQSGTNGGVMSHTMGGNNYWAQVAVSMLPTVPDAPPTHEWRQTLYRFHGLFGAEATPEVLPRTGIANNTPLNAHPTSIFRLRVEIKAFTANAPAIGVVLYCQKTSEGVYRAILDTFGSSIVRLYGAGAPGSDPAIPSALTPTTAQLTVDGDFVAGLMQRSEPAVVILPALAVNKHAELEYTLVSNAAVNDTIDCQVRQDSGATITYTVTPRININPLSSGAGF